MPCPKCQFTRFWKLRRGHARCKRCNAEWSLRAWLVPGIRATTHDWTTVIELFLRDRVVLEITRAGPVSHVTTHKMLTVIRIVMADDIPKPFRGPVEADDAFLGPRWHNRRPWQRGTKRGRGTDQQPVLGLFDRKTGLVVANLIPKVRWQHLQPIFARQLTRNIRVFTDTYTAYHPLQRHGYQHKAVDHGKHEYVRGEVGVNHVESFWGYVKRRYKVTGGIRANRLHLYLAEWVWRYNHRTLSREAKVKRLINLLKRAKF